MKLRPKQLILSQDIDKAWSAGHNVVMAVAPTGFGKTVLFSDKLLNIGEGVAIAHRQELVAQMSLTLARNGVEHRILATDQVRGMIERLHLKHLGRRFVHPGAPVAAAGVGTLIRMPDNDPFLRSRKLWIGDEGHHFLKHNQWGRAVGKIGRVVSVVDSWTRTDAQGLLVTATPLRADGMGLGSKWDGLADTMVLAPGMRDVINDGMLTDYKLHAPPMRRPVDLASVPLSAGGDFSPKPLSAAMHKSSIVGDVVEAYLRIAPGLRGITFATDLEHAKELAAAYQAAGVPAAILSGKSDPGYRAWAMAAFAEGELLQLVNVDILGEGTDVPACSVVSFARPTMSFGLYVQQFGRALRLMISEALNKIWGDLTPEQRLSYIAQSEKPYAHIIDHVSNWERHNLPDSPRAWSLARRERSSSKALDDAIPLRTCLHKDEETGITCTTVYERTLPECPECGHAPTVAGRSRPEQVDGDITEIDPAVLAKLRGEAERLLGPAQIPHNASGIVEASVKKAHRERREAQQRLEEAIGLYGAWQMSHLERPEAEAYKRFYFMFGVDVATARTLGKPDALALAERVEHVLLSNGVVNIQENAA